MQDLWTRFQRDLTKNWKKTAALGLLFLFGCCFWIPMALRASTPRHAASSAAMNPIAAPAAANSNEPGSLNTDAFWSSLSKSLASDPLFQPAEISLVSRDPFFPDESLTALPVLFAEEYVEKKTEKPIATKENALAGLELRSTMVGRTRRVAIINGELCQVGKELRTNGHSFRLASIESQRVVLTSGDKKFELTLARPKLADVLNRDRAVDLPELRTP